MKSLEIEIALMEHLGVRQNTIVPNVSWSFLNYEADLVMLTGSGYATEIEIKVSKSDLKRDKEKRHYHDSDYFKYLYFAVPEKLTEFALTKIPERAGLYKVIDNGYRYFVEQVKSPILNKNHKKWSPKERLRFAELGCMRILGLKKKLIEVKR